MAFPNVACAYIHPLTQSPVRVFDGGQLSLSLSLPLPPVYISVSLPSGCVRGVLVRLFHSCSLPMRPSIHLLPSLSVCLSVWSSNRLAGCYICSHTRVCASGRLAACMPVRNERSPWLADWLVGCVHVHDSTEDTPPHVMSCHATPFSCRQ